jgi:hypothetical protein
MTSYKTWTFAVAAALLGLSSVLSVTNAQSRASSSLSIPAPSLRSVGIIPTPPSPATPAPGAVIGAPAPRLNAVPSGQLNGIAPLSPPIPQLTNQLPSGGSSGVSLPGGGREGLQACLEFWDRETHMTKAEWKASCERSIKRIEGVGAKSGAVLVAPPISPSPIARVATIPLSTSADEIRARGAQWFAQCVADWESTTHMSKQEWQTTCRRVEQERVNLLVEDSSNR